MITNKSKDMANVLVRHIDRMSDSPPTPSTSLPAAVVDSLGDCSPEQLRQIASYAEELADYREQETSSEESENKAKSDGEHEDLPDDVPAKATTTIKEINGNRYYYWQWRDGDQIKSKYKSPVTSDGGKSTTPPYFAHPDGFARGGWGLSMNSASNPSGWAVNPPLGVIVPDFRAS